MCDVRCCNWELHRSFQALESFTCGAKSRLAIHSRTHTNEHDAHTHLFICVDILDQTLFNKFIPPKISNLLVLKINNILFSNLQSLVFDNEQGAETTTCVHVCMCAYVPLNLFGVWWGASVHAYERNRCSCIDRLGWAGLVGGNESQSTGTRIVCKTAQYAQYAVSAWLGLCV